MDRLVALDLAPGPAFVAALRAVWDAGDAALPVDQRLPRPARAALVAAMEATAVIGPDGVETALAGGRPVERGDAVVVATSGTTGAPKGVVLTGDALAAHAAAVNARLAVDRTRDRWYSCLPLAHVGGLGVVVRAVITDTPVEVVDRFDAAAVEASARRGATLVSLVPTALDRTDASGYRWVVLGGSGDRKPRPANVVHTYGMTESGGGVVYGTRPLDGVEVRVAGGEIQLRSPTLLRAYRDGTDPRLPDGWYPTGDAGEIDGDGRLTVHGRRHDLIVTGGENVWPHAVESVLADAPGVAAVVVGGVDDSEWGQRVVAWVEADPAGPAPTLDGLRAHAKERLPAFAAPREVRVVASLDRTALGKVRRPSAVRHPGGP